MPRPRLQLAATARREKVQLRIREQSLGTCGSVHVQSFNDNLKELGVVESKRGAIRKGLVQELLYAQDTVLCSYFAQREGTTNGDTGRRSMAAEVFQGLDRFG